MEAPNIQLYNLFRLDLRLTDGKSLELMHLLDKEYKSGVKDDLNILDKKIDTKFDILDKKFDVLDTKFDVLDKKFDVLDKRFDTLDNKIDKKGDEIRIELRDMRVEMTRWMVAIILTTIAMFIGYLFKK
jgi:chaperonin cofactor prefoldin